eukprot:TRINITY_DN16441_c0_g1_i1.p1 TRINITY_DN16441_c0_g1~~TRINITY_DN16441_c0_g1_i1.p1  ORF type:complete len:333 (+),score=16.11 TRINITY_DN16441_c0_g1_i1:75-1073(+)
MILPMGSTWIRRPRRVTTARVGCTSPAPLCACQTAVTVQHASLGYKSVAVSYIIFVSRSTCPASAPWSSRRLLASSRTTCRCSWRTLRHRPCPRFRFQIRQFATMNSNDNGDITLSWGSGAFFIVTSTKPCAPVLSYYSNMTSVTATARFACPTPTGTTFVWDNQGAIRSGCTYTSCTFLNLTPASLTTVTLTTSNIFGSTATSATMSTKTSMSNPNQPLNCRVISIKDTSATVTCDSTGVTPSEMRFEVNHPSLPPYTEVTVPYVSGGTIIPGLKPLTLYTLRMAERTPFGQGDWSDPLPVSTSGRVAIVSGRPYLQITNPNGQVSQPDAA